MTVIETLPHYKLLLTAKIQLNHAGNVLTIFIHINFIFYFIRKKPTIGIYIVCQI